MQKRAIIVHGLGADSSMHWFPWLKKELEKRNFHAKVLDMPEPASLEEWVSSIKRVVGRADNDTYFIGHSLGCLAILHYLEKLPAGEKAWGCILVAGFLEDIGIPEIKEFYDKKLDFDRIKEHAKSFLVVLSDNDYVVPLKKGLQMQKKLRAKLIIEHHKGHFNTQDGVIELKSVLDEIIKMAGES